MKIKFSGLIVILILNLYNLFGQEGGHIFDQPLSNTVITPSPTSSVFRQFAGYTPSLATGTIEIPIPLYEIKVGNFSLPFILQYYTSGIKASDSPYPAGYGWVLNPGLRITRTTMGRPDDHYKMAETNYSDYDFAYLKSAIYESPARSNDKTLHDTQHDIFTIHLPKGNFSFLLNKINNTFQAITAGNLLKIKTVLNTKNQISAFEVLDENGFFYYFGVYPDERSEMIASIESVGAQEQEITSWALRKIKLPGNYNEINLNWEYFHLSLPNDHLFVTKGASMIDRRYTECSIIEPYIYMDPSITGWSPGFGQNYANVLRLHSVEFPNGIITLDYSVKDQNDFLKSFIVKNLDNTTVKTVNFFYGQDPNVPLLESIAISDEGKYKFQYHPARFNKNNCLDYWGYNNDKQNRTLIPKMKIKVYTNRYGYNSRFVEFGDADRSIDAEKMKAYILTRIDYPTGGYSEFKYEPHRFPDQMPGGRGLHNDHWKALSEGGGLRVTQVLTQSADIYSNQIIKTYKYGMNENGLANIKSAPTLDTFVDEYIEYEYRKCSQGADNPLTTFVALVPQRRLSLNALSNYNKYNLFSPTIWYDYVTEYIGNWTKVLYRYSSPMEDDMGAESTYTSCNAADAISPDFNRRYPLNYYNIFKKRPLLSSKISYLYKPYEGIYQPLEVIDYNYNIANISTPIISNVFVDRVGLNTFVNLNNESSPDFISCSLQPIGSNIGHYELMGELFTYLYKNYSIYPYYDELSNIQTTLYSDKGAVTQLQEFKYVANTLLTKKESTTSDNNSKITENYLYPMDYISVTDQTQKSILMKMYDLNMLSYPISVTQTLETSVEKKRIEYKDWGNNLLLPEKIYVKKQNNPEELRIIYNAYNTSGNPVSLVQDNVNCTVYLWSYLGQYLVAEIKNATFLEVETAVKSIFGSTMTVDDLSRTNVPNEARLKDGSLQKALPKALVSTYTYQPLVGMLTATGPSGLTTYYDYDNFGRLSILKDNQKNKIARYDYRYASEIPPVLPDIDLQTKIGYAKDKSATFNATYEESLLSLKFDWYLKNASGQILQSKLSTTEDSFSAVLNQAGKMTLECRAYSNGQEKTVSKTFDVVTITQPLQFQSLKPTGYYQTDYCPIFGNQQPFGFEAVASGGSGYYSYDWYIEDDSGIAFYELNNQSDKQFSYSLYSPGEYAIGCTIRDLITDEITGNSLMFKIKESIHVELTNISQSGNVVTATINASSPVRIKMQIGWGGATNDAADIRIAASTFSFRGIYEYRTVEVNLSQGANPVSVTFNYNCQDAEVLMNIAYDQNQNYTCNTAYIDAYYPVNQFMTKKVSKLNDLREQILNTKK